MTLSESFRARGHPNITSTHRTTLMITRDTELTPKGNCVVAAGSEKGLSDLDPRLKNAMRGKGSEITLELVVGEALFSVSGKGDPRLTFGHPRDMVARKSSYICDRTLMIRADKASCDIDSSMVRLLRDGNQEVRVTISVTPVTQGTGIIV